MNNSTLRNTPHEYAGRQGSTIRGSAPILLVFVCLGLAQQASAQVFSVPVRWCVIADDANGNGQVDSGEMGAPAFTSPGTVGEPDTDNVLWRRHERPSDNIFIPEAQITFRSGIYNIVEDATLRFPIIPDPDPNPTGDSFWLYGDILDPNDSGYELNLAYNACIAAWTDQHGVGDIGVVALNAFNVRTIGGDSGPGVAVRGGRRLVVRDNAYLLPGSPLFGTYETPPDVTPGDHVDKHFGHEMGHALASLRHTCSNQNLMTQRRYDPSGDDLVDNIHLSSNIEQVTNPGLNGRECAVPTDPTINPDPDDTTELVNQIQALRDAAQAAPGCKIAGTDTNCTHRSDIRADRIKDADPSFADLSTFTATDEDYAVKLIHEPMGPLARKYFEGKNYFDYYSFVDQDQNSGTGGSAEDLGTEVRFKGAELATRVRVQMADGRFVFEPTVWRFSGGSWAVVEDRRVHAYGFPLIAVTDQRSSHLTDQITIEMPQSVFGPAVSNFRLQAAVIAYAPKAGVLDLLDENEQNPGRVFRWVFPTFPVCSVTPEFAPRGGSIKVVSKSLVPNRPAHLIFGDRHIANGNAALDGSVTITAAVPADAVDGQHLITVGTDSTALTADCIATVKGGDRPRPREWVRPKTSN